MLTRADHQSYREVPFRLPDGVTRLTVELDHQGRAERTVVDLGLRDPERFRGWSGGNKARITVSAEEATPSYLPGPLPAGEWRVLLGVPNVRAGARSPYRVRVWFERGARFAGFAETALKAEPGWYAGDLHTHTAHSDGACPPRGAAADAARAPCPVHRTVEAAEAAKLDWVAVTDHNTTSQAAALRELQPHHPSLLLMAGRETTTFNGHLNVIGPIAELPFQVDRTRSMDTVLRAARATGGLVVVNHPTLPSGEACMGCGWTAANTDWRLVDAIEVVNGGSVRASGGAVERPLSGVPFWHARLNEGRRLTAVAASDNHDASLTPETPSAVGRPRTVVWAAALAQPAILEGLRAGRAYLDMEGSGAALDFSAEAGGLRAVMGGDLTAPAGRAVRFRTSAPAGARVEVIVDGGFRPELDGRDFTLPGDGRRRWVRVDVRGADGRLQLIGNPIYLNWPPGR